MPAPSKPASLPDPRSSPLNPSGSQSQFRTTSIESTKNWVRSFILPDPGPRSPGARAARARRPRATGAGTRRGAVQRKPRKPRIQPLAACDRTPSHSPKRVAGVYPPRASRRREPLLILHGSFPKILCPSCITHLQDKAKSVLKLGILKAILLRCPNRSCYKVKS